MEVTSVAEGEKFCGRCSSLLCDEELTFLSLLHVLRGIGGGGSEGGREMSRKWIMEKKRINDERETRGRKSRWERRRIKSRRKGTGRRRGKRRMTNGNETMKGRGKRLMERVNQLSFLFYC